MDPTRTPPPYHPIACASYEQYEMAILRRRPIRLVYRHDGVQQEETVMPVDLRTTQGQEFLGVQRSGGDTAEIRLDTIDRAEVVE